MTTGSLFETTGISIAVWQPTIDTGTPLYTPRGLLVTTATSDQVTAYQHEIQADGGFWTATLQLSLNLIDAENWLETGLNRHIETFNSAGETIWAGFVNQITLVAGTLTAVRGPLMDVVNRSSVVYTPILDATTTPPIEGTETTTTIADDTASQTAYGIMEGIVAGGRLLDDGTTDDAVQLRDAYLQEHKDPQTSEDLNLSQGSNITISLDLLGYVHRFSKYIYQDTTAATIQVDAKLQAVIAADPNRLFSTDYSRIASNALLTSRYENDNRNAWDVLTQEVGLGDVLYNRYNLAVYRNQQITYAAVPATVLYRHAITEKDVQINLFVSGAPIDPWDVLPAQWIFLNDFLPGRGLPGTPRDDPRYIFIEGVRYTAPREIQIQGQKVAQLSQLMAQLAG